MARRNFYEMVRKSDLNINAEYSRIHTMYYEGTDGYYPVVELVEGAFESFPSTLRGRTISPDDFDNTYGFKFPAVMLHLTTEHLISFCEYIWNFCIAIIKYNADSIDPDDAKNIDRMLTMIKACMDDLGMEIHEIDNLFIYVESKPDVIAAIELVEEELAGNILRYHHHTLKGDLSKKKAILKLMADDIESDRQKLRGINSTLETQLFQLLNKFIRHDQSKTPYIETMNPQEIEECYDDIYQMWLLAKLELDHQALRKVRVKDLLDKINA